MNEKTPIFVMPRDAVVAVDDHRYLRFYAACAAFTGFLVRGEIPEVAARHAAQYADMLLVELEKKTQENGGLGYE